jgi:hypothetical protein
MSSAETLIASGVVHTVDVSQAENEKGESGMDSSRSALDIHA